MSEQEFPDIELIPLPDDIPVPDEIPLPPDNERGDNVNNYADEPALTNTGSGNFKKRQAPDDDEILETDTNKQHKPASQQQKQQNKKLKSQHQQTRQREPSPILSDSIRQERELMARLMGFTDFDSTKGKMVPGNQLIGAVHVVKKRRYRQYMNRKGGFNRPLDKVP